MGWQDLLLRLRALAGAKRADDEMDEELRFHLEMQERKHRAAGLDGPAARRQARLDFGGVEAAREECRDARGVSLFTDIGRDLRYGLRMLRRSPGFAAVAVLSLGIGIGANTAIFSLIDAVLYRTLPVEKPEELVVLRWGAAKGLDISLTWANNEGDKDGGWTTDVVSWPMFDDMRQRARTLRGIAGFSPLSKASVAAHGQTLVTGGLLVSGNFFETVGIEPLRGRTIRSDDDGSGGAMSAVITYGMWERVFGLDPSVIGQTLLINRQPFVVAGVTRRDFAGISPGGFAWTRHVDFMIPIRAASRVSGRGAPGLSWFDGELCWIQIMARLRPDSGPAAVMAELAPIIYSNLAESNQRTLGAELPRIVVKPGSRGLSGLHDAYRNPLLLLLSVSGLTLLMACANLAGLLLARASARRKEIMVRLAVGARRGRLIRQLLIEGALLSALGAAVGLLFAWWGVHALLALVETGSVPILVEVRPDVRILAFTAAVSLATTLLFALAPAIRATRVDLIAGLKEETPVSSHDRRPRLAQALVMLQVAAAVLLVAGAVLFSRSLMNLLARPLGFNADRLVVFNLSPGTNGYDEVSGNRLYVNVLDRLTQSRGISSASLAWSRLMTGGVSNGAVRLEGGDPGKPARALFNFVGPGYFTVMQIPLAMGRDIEQRDLNSKAPVAVVNEAFARKYLSGGSPIGRRFRWWGDNKPSVEVVGVVKDSLYARVRSRIEPTLYAPYASSPFGWPETMCFTVRTAAGPAETMASIQRAVHEVDPALPIVEPATMREQIGMQLFDERLFAILVTLFGALTVALACVGLYGMVSWSVASRTREIGVRVALGADRASVTWMVLGQVWAIALVGLAAGMASAIALGRVIESRLYGVKANDPLSLCAAAGFIVVVAMAAAIVPVRRALRIDPVSALRYE